MTDSHLGAQDIGDGTRSEPQIDLFLVSFLALFLELLLIRWIPAYERVVAYFTNFVLISAFLGLGIGAMLKPRIRETNTLRYLTVILCMLVIATLVFNRYVATNGVPQDLFYTDFTREAKLHLVLPECLSFFYVFVAVVFIPVGQSVASGLDSVTPALRGYMINLLGSVAGVLAFSAMSLFSLGPWWWFITALAVLQWLTRGTRSWRVFNCVVALATIVTVWWAARNFVWTPYNKLTIRAVEQKPDGDIGRTDEIVSPRRIATLRQTLGFNLAVNDDLYQQAQEGRPSVLRARGLDQAGQMYNLPYELIPNLPRDDVLVVGAGTGNDVAAALRHGAMHVDAVEIDPGIYRLGKLGHPEQPYDDPRVQVFVNDARSFFNNTKRKYNLIVFGLLDAHGLFSSMSSVRLDSFVYTVESFGEVSRLLKENGVVYVQHALGAGYLDVRMYWMLHTVFGSSTQLLPGKGGSLAFFAGPGVPQHIGKPVSESTPRLERATDDWPFFYLVDRVMPPEYRQALESMLVLSLLLILLFSPGELRRIDVHFFALGAAFMLIETVSVTRFALLFGSTWIVNSVVFTAVLLVVLLANLWMNRLHSVNVHALYVCLAGAVLLNLFFPIHSLLTLVLPLRLFAAMTLMATPIFFAAFIFARSYKQTHSVPLAYASNLLGAVIGGLLEYSSLILGFKSQLLNALLLYGLSYLALVRSSKKTTSVTV